MRVPDGHRNGHAWNTFTLFMNRARVSASAARLADLIPDAGFTGDVAHKVNQAGIREGSPVRDVQGGAGTQAGVVPDIFITVP